VFCGLDRLCCYTFGHYTKMNQTTLQNQMLFSILSFLLPYHLAPKVRRLKFGSGMDRPSVYDIQSHVITAYTLNSVNHQTASTFICKNSHVRFSTFRSYDSRIKKLIFFYPTDNTSRHTGQQPR